MIKTKKVVIRLLSVLVVTVLLLTPIVSITVAAAPGPWTYTALGDSLAFGVFDFQRGGYVPRYGAYVQTDTSANVSLNNLGRNGWTSSQLLNALRTDQNFRGSVSSSQIVTWDIGGNDFLRARSGYQAGTCGGANNQDCIKSTVATFKANWDSIIAEILSLRSISNTVIRTMDIYNPYINEDKASDSWRDDGGLNDFDALKPYLDDVNRYIATRATINNIPYAKVYEAFNGPAGNEDPSDKGYISFDGLHPDDSGHKVIADLLRSLGYAPLIEPAPALTAVQFSQASYNVAESGGSVQITVTRSGDTSSSVAVDYATNDNSAGARCDAVTGAASERCDYSTATGTLSLAPGEATKTFTVIIIDDGFADGTETLSLALSKPTANANLGGQSTATLTITDNDVAAVANPIDTNSFFVRQQYIDFLSREPEQAGFDAWLAVLNRCGAGDSTCDRTEVSASFFRSEEFQSKGYFVYRFYKVSLGRLPSYTEMIADMGRVTGATGDEVIAKKAAFTSEWVKRPEFKAKYDGLSNAAYVDELLRTAGVTLAIRDQLVADLQNNLKTRAEVLRVIVESQEVYSKEYNGAFVAMQYFGYLRRDPEPEGYAAWLRVIERNPADYRTMVNGFIASVEYRLRFGQP
ncbi:MAG: DUF4214 domain-containing protein [Pyrinomonadaceae bacterium]|nr:DUF4214 domain-containing protein [Pyrinomonadaceae bacterium]